MKISKNAEKRKKKKTQSNKNRVEKEKTYSMGEPCIPGLYAGQETSFHLSTTLAGKSQNAPATVSFTSQLDVYG